MLAVRGGHENCVRTLLHEGIDINMFDISDCSALMNSIRYAHYGCIKILIEAGALSPVLSEQYQGEYAYKALCCAAENGRHKVLAELMSAGVSINNSPSQYLQHMYPHYKHYASPLILAAQASERRQAYSRTPAEQPKDKDDDFLICIKQLLKAGVYINVESGIHNALETHLMHQDGPKMSIATTLYAAGEQIEGTCLIRSMQPEVDVVYFPFYIRIMLEGHQFRLKHLCREAIRKHLITVNPKQHLFGRVPQLGLPQSLESYLLFGISLEEEFDPEYSYIHQVYS